MVKKLTKHFKRILSVCLVFVMGTMFFACKDKPKSKEYTLTLPVSVDGGSIKADKTTVMEGDNFTITVEPQEDMMVSYIRANGKDITLYENEYTFYSVQSDIVVELAFVSAIATISFQSETEEMIENKEAVIYSPYGELPTPSVIPANSVFAGWYTEATNGSLVKASSIVRGSITLYARFVDATQAIDSEKIIPQAITCSIYNSDGDYGVTYHTEVQSPSPVVQVASKTDIHFSNPTVFACNSTLWNKRYTVQGVISGLSKGEYLVRVGDSVANVFSDAYTLSVKTADTDGNFSFLHVTDTQQTWKTQYLDVTASNPANNYKIHTENAPTETFWSMVMKDASKRFPESSFVTHGGDIVNYGAEYSYWVDMLEDYQKYTFEYPVNAIGGNHENPSDYGAGKTEMMSNYFNMSLPAQTEATGVYYSYDYGKVHFVMLDSNECWNFTGTGYKMSDEQLNWLENDLKQNEKNPNTVWTIVTTHEGPVVPTRHSNALNDHYQTLRPQLMPILDKYDVDLLMYGHNHYLSSTYPLVYDEDGSIAVNDTYGIGGEYNEKYVGVVTTDVDTVAMDVGGESVSFDSFTNYTSGSGTVMHQIATSGMQLKDTFKLANNATDLQNYVLYRALSSGGKGAAFGDDKYYSMYSYIEVNTDSLGKEYLRYRTYGVNYVDAAANEYTAAVPQNERLVDAFILYK